LKVRTSWPVDASHTLTVSSKEPVARRRPSGLKATAITWAVCPSRTRSGSPVVASHSRAVPSQLPLARRRPSGLHLPCHEEHEHGRYCFLYGFHDLRRAFATMNADKLTPDALQALMRHKSYLTTQKYINMARQMDAAVASLHVPDVLKKEMG
jgi:integrase